jgi:hypothetical protein
MVLSEGTPEDADKVWSQTSSRRRAVPTGSNDLIGRGLCAWSRAQRSFAGWQMVLSEGTPEDALCLGMMGNCNAHALRNVAIVTLVD